MQGEVFQSLNNKISNEFTLSDMKAMALNNEKDFSHKVNLSNHHLMYYLVLHFFYYFRN